MVHFNMCHWPGQEARQTALVDTQPRVRRWHVFCTRCVYLYLIENTKIQQGNTIVHHDKRDSYDYDWS